MRLLLDSRALLWAVDSPERLSPLAREQLQITANQLLISAASIWEIAIKVGLNKLTLTLPYKEWMAKSVQDLGAEILPISIDYADAQTQLPNHHRDPFDRMIVAQAIVEGVAIVSNDERLDLYGVQRIW